MVSDGSITSPRAGIKPKCRWDLGRKHRWRGRFTYRSSTEDPQLDVAASRCSLTTSQLRDHVFDWRSDPWADVSHQVNSATFSVPVAHKKGGRPLSHPPSEEMLDAFKAPLPQSKHGSAEAPQQGSTCRQPMRCSSFQSCTESSLRRFTRVLKSGVCSGCVLHSC